MRHTAVSCFSTVRAAGRGFTALLLVTGFYWRLLSVHYIIGHLIILFIGLPARTLSCVCNFLLLRFFFRFRRMLTAWEKKHVCAKMDPVRCLLLWKGSNYSVMIALTWCTQLCKLYSCTKLFCLLDQVPVNWFKDYCILLTLLFFLYFVLLLILDVAFSLSLLSFSQSFACPDTQWRKWNRGPKMKGQPSLQAPVWCWLYEQSLFPVALGMF